MVLTIYGVQPSPPFRAVVLTAKLIGLPYVIKEINVIKGRNFTPEYLKINPLHTIPTIDDNGFILFESNAIVTYLIDKYGNDDTLYPKDLQLRAIINQRLHFNGNNLFARFLQVALLIITKTEIPEDVLQRVTESLTFLEALLGDNDWVAHTPNFTVADVCLLSTLENLNGILPDALKDHPKLVAWLQRGRSEIPGFEEYTKPAVQTFRKVLGLEKRGSRTVSLKSSL